jgi:hypothetical protein
MVNMGFWREQLERFKLAMVKRQTEAFWIAAAENSREMKTTYARLGTDIPRWFEWLTMMADAEDAGASAGSIFMSVGGFE